MNGSLVKEIRLALGLTQVAMARKLEVHKRSIQRWESTGESIHGPVKILLDQMKEQALRSNGLVCVTVKRPMRRKRLKWPKRD